MPKSQTVLIPSADSQQNAKNQDKIVEQFTGVSKGAYTSASMTSSAQRRASTKATKALKENEQMPQAYPLMMMNQGDMSSGSGLSLE